MPLERFELYPCYLIMRSFSKESALMPQGLLMGWTFASAFYKNDMTTLLEAFGIDPKVGCVSLEILTHADELL